jgi:hypothetical protein
MSTQVDAQHDGILQHVSILLRSARHAAAVLVVRSRSVVRAVVTLQPLRLATSSAVELLAPRQWHSVAGSEQHVGRATVAKQVDGGVCCLLRPPLVTFVVCCVHLLTHAQHFGLSLLFLRTARALLPCCADLSFRLMMTPSTEQQSAGEWHTLLHARSPQHPTAASLSQSLYFSLHFTLYVTAALL